MAGSRKALIVANDSYDDAALSALSSAAADATALEQVFSAPDIGGFQVAVCRNEPHYVVQEGIEEFFAGAIADDLLLLYFSGHGLKADTGELFLAARNTRPTRLGSTAVAASFVNQCMTQSRSRAVVLFLDCCYGGAFSLGTRVRAGGPVDVMSSFGLGSARDTGRGRAVITASNSMQYAFEGAHLVDDSPTQPSVFAAALSEGLRSGDADRDEDGMVSIEELYDWVHDRVHEANPAQTPTRQFDLAGKLHIARSGRRKIQPAALPAELEAALADPNMFSRIGALTELGRRLASEDLGAAMAALRALREIAGSDLQQVASEATKILDRLTLRVDPPSITLRPPDSATQVETVLVLTGLPLARAVTARANSLAIQTRTEGTSVTVSLIPSSAAHPPYVITLEGPAGVVSVPVEITVSPDTDLSAIGASTVAEQPQEQELEEDGGKLGRLPWARRRTLVVAAAVLVVAGGATTWAAIEHGDTPRTKPLPAVVPQLPRSAPLPANKLIAPREIGGKAADLWSIPVGGGTARQLTTGDHDDLAPALSPDRKTIIFARGDPTSASNPPALYVMAADGSGQRPLFTTQPAAALALGGRAGRPSWSPDGSSLAATVAGTLKHPGALYVISLTDGVARRVAVADYLGDPAWSRNGHEVVYWAGRSSTSPAGTLMKVALSGNSNSEPQRVLLEGSTSDADPAWSLDGKMLAFSRDSAGQGIWVANANGTNAQRLTTNEDFDPTWSPDGRQIAFRSLTSGRGDEYVIDADGGQPALVLQNSSGPDLAPSWTR